MKYLSLFCEIVLHRVFPFARGLFEDKGFIFSFLPHIFISLLVANIWFCLCVLLDIRQILPPATLPILALILTLVMLVPVVLLLLSKPLTPSSLLLSLTTSGSPHFTQSTIQPSLLGLAFFLASYQVHEKSALLFLVPAYLLLPSFPSLLPCLLAGQFSLFPLLLKDGQAPNYLLLSLLQTLLLFVIVKETPLFQTLIFKILNLLTIGGIFTLHLFQLLFPSPFPSLPHIHPTLNALFCTLIFSLTYIYLSYTILKEFRKIKIT